MIGRSVRVELRDRRILDVERQQGARRVDLLAHLLRFDVDVVAELELDEDLRDAFARGRAQRADALDGVDLLLEDVGDLGLDGLGRGPLQHRGDGDEGHVDVGVEIGVEPPQADQAEHDQPDVEHQGEDRPADREEWQVHEPVSSVVAWKVADSRVSVSTVPWRSRVTNTSSSTRSRTTCRDGSSG